MQYKDQDFTQTRIKWPRQEHKDTREGLKFRIAIQKEKLQRHKGVMGQEKQIFLGFFVDFRYWNKTNLKRGKQKYTSQETRSNLIPIDRVVCSDLPRGR